MTPGVFNLLPSFTSGVHTAFPSQKYCLCVEVTHPAAISQGVRADKNSPLLYQQALLSDMSSGHEGRRTDVSVPDLLSNMELDSTDTNHIISVVS